MPDENTKITDNNFVSLITPAILFVTIKILCDPLFMNTINFNIFNIDFVITQSSFLYTLIFIILDISALKYGLKNTYKLIILGMVMDCIYSFGVFSSGLFHIPDSSIIGTYNHIRTTSIHNIAEPTMLLFVSSIISTTITNFIEVTLFNYLYKRLFKNSMFFSTIISVSLVILTNNLIMFPIVIKDYSVIWHMYWSNFAISISLVTVYTSIYILFLKNLYTSSKIKSKN